MNRRVILATFAAFVLTTHAQAGDMEEVVAAVEKLRVAMVEGDGKALAELVDDHLSYAHSTGRVEDKAAFIKVLDKTNYFKSIVLSKQTVSVVGRNAIVRHVFDGEINAPDGKTTPAYINVLQVWHKSHGKWKILARHASALQRT